ncbi:MAG: glycosyltransferase family 4 protein [Sulfolobales archaeon]
MRILYVIDDLEPQYPRDQNYIIKYMLEKGHDVSIVTTRNPSERYDLKVFPRAKIYRYPTIGSIGTIKIYFPSLLKLSKHYDVVHTFTFYTFSTLPASVVRARVKVIRSEISHPNSRRVWRGSTVFKPLTEIYKALFDIVTAYNEREVESLAKLGFPRNKILLLPPMIDTKRLRAARRELGERIVIGILSRITPEKGLHKIPEILSLLDRPLRENLEIILAGRIEDQVYGEAVINKLRNAMGKRFIYIGELEDPIEFYRRIDLLFFTSIRETGAITVLEAMASGKVVISRNIHPVDLYIEDMRTGVLFNTSREAAEKLSSLLNDRRKISMIQSMAVERASQYEYRILCRKLEKAYERSLDPPS